MADDLYGELTQLMILTVCKCLRRSHHDTFAGMYPQRVEVLHVTDGYTVVEPVAHHLIFNLLPALE